MHMKETVERAMQNGALAPLAQKYRTAQVDLLILVGMTLLNVVLLLTGSSTYFLFSGAVPYYLVFFGMLFCGTYPEMQSDPELLGMVIFPSNAIVWFLLAALLILAVYVVLFLLSRKQYHFLTAALVLFALDTAAMLYLGGISIDNAIDLLFHAWMLYSLFAGIRAAKVLVSTPVEDTVLPTSAYSEIEDDMTEDCVAFVEASDTTEGSAVLAQTLETDAEMTEGDPATDVPTSSPEANVAPEIHITSNKEHVDPANFTEFHDFTKND